MGKYVVVKGSHFQNGREYKAGQEVETSQPLDKLFKNKFRKVSENEVKESVKAPQIPLPPASVGEDKGAGKTPAPASSVSALGDDVSEKFELAKSLAVKVYRKPNGQISIIDEIDGSKLNDKPLLNKAAVVKFLADMAETVAKAEPGNETK